MAEELIYTSTDVAWKTSRDRVDNLYKSWVVVYRLTDSNENGIPLKSAYKFYVMFKRTTAGDIPQYNYTRGPHYINNAIYKVNGTSTKTFNFPTAGNKTVSANEAVEMFWFTAECWNLGTAQAIQINIQNNSGVATPYKFYSKFVFTTAKATGPSFKTLEFINETASIKASWEPTDSTNLQNYQLTLYQQTPEGVDLSDTHQTYVLDKNITAFNTTMYNKALLPGCTLCLELCAKYLVNSYTLATNSVNTSICIPGGAYVRPTETTEVPVLATPYMCIGKINGVKQWVPAISYVKDGTWCITNI